MMFTYITVAFFIICIVSSIIIWRKRYSLGPYKLKEKRNVRNVYVLRTHLLNEFVEYTFKKMQEQLGAENVFILFDETKGKVERPHVYWNNKEGVNKGPAIITINESDCKIINTLHNQGERPGSQYRVEAQIYACYKAIRSSYDYLWFIEYDVFCKDYKKALSRFDAVEADMLTKGTANPRQRSIRTTKRNSNWFWWNSLIGDISSVPMEQRRGCFFPINRFSKKFLSVLEQNLSKSSGYCEVYFPTLCNVNNLTLQTMPLNTFATFRYKPNVANDKIIRLKPKDYKLYHPVKELIAPPTQQTADSSFTAAYPST